MYDEMTTEEWRSKSDELRKEWRSKSDEWRKGWRSCQEGQDIPVGKSNDFIDGYIYALEHPFGTVAVPQYGQRKSPVREEVYWEEYDTAGNYHWYGTEQGIML